jgi:hypothetical protein
MNNPSDPTDAPAPKPPAGDNDWFILHAFDDGSSFIEGLDGDSGR